MNLPGLRERREASMIFQVWFQWGENWFVAGEHCIGKGVAAQFFRPNPEFVSELTWLDDELNEGDQP